MFFGDTGSTDLFDFQTEAGSQYLGAHDPDAWLAFAQSQAAIPHSDFIPCDAACSGVNEDGYAGTFHNNDDGIDWKKAVWSNLRVLQPSVSQGTCADCGNPGQKCCTGPACNGSNSCVNNMCTDLRR